MDDKIIVITIKKDDIDIFEEVIQKFPDSIDIDEIKYAFNGVTVLEIILEITEKIVPIIATILISKKGKVISIKIGGREITAPINNELTLEEVKELLNGELEDKNGYKEKDPK